MTESLLIWLVLGGCACLSFLLSGMEAGVFALSRLRIRHLMRDGNRPAGLLHGYLENPENFLWTIVAGNGVVNCLILGMALLQLHAWLGGCLAWIILAFLAFTFLFYALCDLLPKMIFRTYPNRLCLLLARPFRLAHLALSPLVWLLEGVSRAALRWTGGKAFRGELFGNREELRLVMQESGQVLTSEERAMINRVLDLQTRSVRQTMTALDAAVTVEAATPLGEVLRLCRERNLTRLPVWGLRGNQRRISGVISLDDLLFAGELDSARSAGDFMAPALCLGERMRLEEALQRLQRGGQRLAIVLGSDGREVGLLSLEDILRTVFGDVKL